MPIKEKNRTEFEFNESTSRNIMQGICRFVPKVVNPTNEEYMEAFGHVRNSKEEPVYLTDIVKADGKPGKQLRIDFCGYLYAFSDKRFENGIEYTITYFINNEARPSQKGNYKYIDIYGNTTWDKDGKFTDLQISSFEKTKCRKSFSGEEDLIRFLSKLNDIKPLQVQENNIFIANPNISDTSECEIYFDNTEIQKLFSNKYKEVLDSFTKTSFSIKWPVVVLIGTREAVDKKTGVIVNYPCVYKNKIYSGLITNLGNTIINFTKSVEKNRTEKEHYEIVDGYIVKPDEETKATYNTKDSIPSFNKDVIPPVNEEEMPSNISDFSISDDADLPF